MNNKIYCRENGKALPLRIGLVLRRGRSFSLLIKTEMEQYYGNSKI